jgi:hypothetical protein
MTTNTKDDTNEASQECVHLKSGYCNYCVRTYGPPSSPATVAEPTHPNGVPMGKPWSEVKANLLKDPEVKAEYDRLTVAEGSEPTRSLKTVLSMHVGAEDLMLFYTDGASEPIALSKKCQRERQEQTDSFVDAIRSTAIPKEEVERAIGEEESFIYDQDTHEESPKVVRADSRNELRAEIRSKLGLGTTNNANTGGGDE